MLIQFLPIIKWTIIAITVIIIAVIFFWMFKKAICNFFTTISNRANNLYYKGSNKEFNLSLGSVSQNVPADQMEYANAKHLELLKAFQSSIVTTEEVTIKKQLSEAKITSEQAINVLINHLANANLTISLLAIDKLIFPEQIKLLLHLNTQFAPIPETNLFHFYEEWVNKTKLNNFTFENFLGFLSQYRLIAQSIQGYSISVLGKEYLSFLIRIGKAV